MAAIGLSNRDISHILGIAEATLYRRFKDHPQLEDAICQARANQKKNLLSALHMQGIAGNSKAIIWILQNIHNMTESHNDDDKDINDDLRNKSLEDLEAEFTEITECIETTLQMTKADVVTPSESKSDDSEKLAKT